jgi:homogentisate phytyltransferase/homogentisate geranylgeranyltransferase
MELFGERTKVLIKKIEQSKTDALMFVLVLGSIIMIRAVLEDKVAHPLDQVPSLVFLNNSLTFYLSAFLSAVLLIALLSKTDVKSVSKVTLIAFVAIISAPIIDFFTGKKVFYDYVYDPTVPLSTPNWNYVLRSFSVFGSGVKGITLGLQVETLLFLILSAFYVYVKTKSFARVAVTPFAVYGLVFFYGSFPNIFSFGTLYASFNATHNSQYYSSVFAILIGVQSGLWLHLHDRKKFGFVVRDLASERSLLYMSMAGFGAFLVAAGAYPALLAMLCVLMLWESAKAINNMADITGDRLSKLDNPLLNDWKEADVKFLAVFTGLLALLFAAVLGSTTLIIAVSVIAVSVVYSLPPLRLKRYPFLSTLVIASGALLALLLGFNSVPTLLALPGNFALGILLCFTLAFNTKDLKDYEGDKRTGDLTIPVLLGLKWGRRVIAILDLAAFLLVPLLLRIQLLAVPAVVLGCVTFVLVLREETKEWLLFLPCFAIFVFVFVLYRI